MNELPPIVHSLSQLRKTILTLPHPIGLVPTMGYLHDGHLSLVRRAKIECSSVVVSIFVNPSQFAPSEDLSKYPRDLERDLKLLGTVGVDLVWNPSVEEMYPQGFQTWVMLDELVKPLEGAMRPGHFRGVATIVTKLFNAVQPQKAYFGQKDAQQAAVIKRMTRDLDFPVEVVVCPIVREADGLAMSSRNVYLDPAQRQAATILFRSLNAAKSAYDQGERDAGKIRQVVTSSILSEPLASLQYVSCADNETLEEVDKIEHPCLVSLAVHFGKTRLIDNLVLGKN